MRAIDTNVVVRFLTKDDRRQFQRANAAIEGGNIFLSRTVLLESEWVLRSAYGFPAGRIVGALRGLAGLPGVTVEEPALIAQALDWMADGMDFADALHLGNAWGCEAFLTFDRKLAKAASGRSELRIEEP
ncbi:type II toxin-antitoxin system VapC family toxin [Phenylobacterium sp.]|uniref:type II toxin-antitoxin system VapC family toxin n=1 Tax=Phenylobacterium sp. TaxID=1871053 RepID=UPI002E3427E4|nr:type II toxin-antitoxin system VapC family toxin [Phenylobacterium sp.]HEX4712480.1 type II toxin-antitoxin system VapC family toxin [Phenylobacterium sp.]